MCFWKKRRLLAIGPFEQCVIDYASYWLWVYLITCRVENVETSSSSTKYGGVVMVMSCRPSTCWSSPGKEASSNYSCLAPTIEDLASPRLLYSVISSAIQRSTPSECLLISFHCFRLVFLLSTAYHSHPPKLLRRRWETTRSALGLAWPPFWLAWPPFWLA
jgi:hypothetical protein